MIENSSNVYRDLGVSPSKEDVHKAIKNMDQGLFPGAFCKVLPDVLSHSSDHCLAMHADGAGTKSVLAYLYWKETGDRSIFKGLAQDALVMNLDDLLCIGATKDFVLSNALGRNAHRIPGEIIQEIINGYSECLKNLKEFGISIYLAGGETADVGDLVETLIVDSTMIVRFPRDQIIDASQIQAGDVIVGCSSSGRTKWESQENSGIGSNGLTAARHILLEQSYAHKYPEAFSSTLGLNDVYQGKYCLTDKLDNSSLTVGQALLSPTRTYAPFVKSLIDELGTSQIHGLIHNTGGGLTKSIKFGKSLNYIKENLFQLPPLFDLILKSEKMSFHEMCEVFNLGQRLEVYVAKENANRVLSLAQSLDLDCQIIGQVQTSTESSNQVTIRWQGQEHIFSSKEF